MSELKNVYVTKEIPFCAAHRLMDYDGPCAWIHGHNYVATISILAQENELTDNGMVIDFKEIKEFCKTFIDKYIDHGIILNVNDIEWIKIMTEQEQKVYILPYNPTAENIAAHLYTMFVEKFGNSLAYVKIKETPTSAALYGL